jgi:prepilin-type N-terminal cleavage/methylation domain-containing protein
MRPTNRQRAFTLIELIASMVIIGFVASVAVPLIGAASDSFVTSSNNRDETERLSHAMDRAIRLLRAAPSTAPGSGQPDIAVAATDNIEFADGAGLELIGTTLWLTPAGGTASPLCAGVSAFVISYLGEDGTTSTILTPENTQRFVIRIAAGAQELRGAAFLRIATGSPA